MLPYLALSQIRDTANNGDVEALSALADFPSLRESVIEIVKAKMVQETSKLEDQGLFAGFVMVMTNVLIDRFVDATVSPSGIAAMTQGKQLMEGTDSINEGKPDPQEQPAVQLRRIRGKKPEWAIFHGQRSRFASWTRKLGKR